MRAPNPDQGALFAPQPGPEQARHAMDPHIYLPADPRPTQVEAAERALPKSGTQRARVLGELKRAGRNGLTDEELAARLDLSLNSVRPRRLELVEAMLVVSTERRRPTQGGGPAIVWVHVEATAP
jgi:hypothetical protein